VVTVRGPLQTQGAAQGMIVDFDELAAVVRTQVLEVLDHADLNDVLENPTCERIAVWVWERLKSALPGLDELTLWETVTACAILRRSDFH
jgi:6-pyruvoyltetrahydropterin/6-carboxytetrahydropterin synthase